MPVEAQCAPASGRAVAFAQQDGPFQVGYAADLNIGDSVVNISNDGNISGPFGAQIGGVSIPTWGNICANVYVFDPQEEEIGCCSCLVTPNGLNSLSVNSDLISNNLTPAVPTSVVIKIVGSVPVEAPGTTNFTVCNPAQAGTVVLSGNIGGLGVPQNIPVSGLVVWGTTLEPSSTPGTYSPVDVPFLNGSLIVPPNTNPPTPLVPGTELYGLTQLCNFIQSNGTGYGICKSCRLGALGGAKQ